jgi:DNA polymerase III delta prime subunit
MNEIISDLWVDKYRPQTLDEYVLDADIRAYFRSMLDKKTLQNFALVGCAGMGKTTMAKVLCNELDADVLFVPCSTEGTVDILRTKVQEFCNALSFDNRLKIVVLDEIDSSSSGGSNSFQQALRTLIEEAQSDTRFIITGNFLQKIIPPLLSRCPIIPLKFGKKDLLLHVKKILDTENIKYTRESVKAFIDEAFQYYPDCRRIINYLQFCCNSGELIVNLNNVAESEKNEFIAEIVKKIIETNNVLDVRKFYLANKDSINDYVEAGSMLFNYVVDNGIVTNLDGILKLTDLLFYLNTVIDKESNFFGMVTAIAKWRNTNG